jgi:hypothetical protein
MSRFNPFESMKVALAVRNLMNRAGDCRCRCSGCFRNLSDGRAGQPALASRGRHRSSTRSMRSLDRRQAPTFDYVSPIPERYAFLALGVDGVRMPGAASRVERRSSVRRRSDAGHVIGVERRYRGGLPAVADLAAAKGLSDSALVLPMPPDAGPSASTARCDQRRYRPPRLFHRRDQRVCIVPRLAAPVRGLRRRPSIPAHGAHASKLHRAARRARPRACRGA